MEKWKSWKNHLIFLGCFWVLLSTVFTMQRYGYLIASPEFYSLIWNKLGDIILLRWLNSTLITGFLAIIAALIGAFAIFSSTNKQIKNDKISSLSLCKVHAAICRDKLHAVVTIEEEYARDLIKSSERLSIVDPELTWLSISISRHIQDLSQKDSISEPRYNVIYLRTSLLIDLLERTIQTVKNNQFHSLIDMDYFPEDLAESLRLRDLALKDTGEFNNLFKWSDRNIQAI